MRCTGQMKFPPTLTTSHSKFAPSLGENCTDLCLKREEVKLERFFRTHKQSPSIFNILPHLSTWKWKLSKSIAYQNLKCIFLTMFQFLGICVFTFGRSMFNNGPLFLLLGTLVAIIGGCDSSFTHWSPIPSMSFHCLRLSLCSERTEVCQVYFSYVYPV